MYNCPSKYTLGGGMQPGEFEVCDSDSFPVPGVYTDAAGATQSYAQPPESLGAITTVPYVPTAAATRNCKTFASTDVFAATLAPSSSGTATGTGAASATGTSTGSGAATSKVTSGASTGTGAGAAPTTSTSTNGTASGSSGSGAPEALGLSMVATVAGVLAAISLFA